MKPNYKKIYEIVKKRFDRTNHFYHGPFDETFFSMRVFEMCKVLMKDYKCKKSVILTAALLHDIGKTKLNVDEHFQDGVITDAFRNEWRRHAKLGIPIARRILKKLGHNDKFIEEVCYLIEHHDHRDMKKKTIELKIIQDADLLADIGMAGFIRIFMYGTKFKTSIVDSIKYAQNHKSRSSVEENINLPISKKIAKKRLNLQAKLFKKIRAEIESEII